MFGENTKFQSYYYKWNGNFFTIYLKWCGYNILDPNNNFGYKNRSYTLESYNMLELSFI